MYAFTFAPWARRSCVSWNLQFAYVHVCFVLLKNFEDWHEPQLLYNLHIYTKLIFFFSNHFCGASSRLRTVSQDFMVQCIRAWLMLCKQRPEDVAPATTAIVEVNSHAICWQEKQLWRRWRLRRLTATIQPGLSDLYVCIYIYIYVCIYIYALVEMQLAM